MVSRGVRAKREASASCCIYTRAAERFELEHKTESARRCIGIFDVFECMNHRNTDKSYRHISFLAAAYYVDTNEINCKISKKYSQTELNEGA